jgi:hypothetical protein
MTTQANTNLYKPNEFPYNTQEFSQPLKTRTGRTRLNKYGAPLTSVRIKQDPEHKKRMIDRMVRLYQAWKDMPEYFPVEPIQFGVDPVKMDADRVFNDLIDQVEKWLSGPSNDVLESFIIRHNYYVDHLKKLADVYDQTGQDSADFETQFGIRQVRKRKPVVTKIIDTNFDSLFSVDK